MRVAVDATEALWPQLTGTGIYARQLVRALAHHEQEINLIVLGIRSAQGDAGFAEQVGLRLLRSPRYRSIWSQFRLPLHLLAQRYNLLHVPGHKLPAVCPCRSVVTIHDLAFERFPETFQPGHRQRLRWFTRTAVRRADHIIAISACTQRDLCELYGRSSADITVVHHGVDHTVFHTRIQPASRPRPYILTVGALQPRKNLQMLIRAFNHLDAEVDLLIAGQRGWLWEPIEEEARRSPAAERIHLMGYVPDAELPGLYAGATIVAMPSLYEGFGLPLLEAMACGAPVVASNASCFPEVVGDAAVLVDPKDQDAWTETLRQVLDSVSQRDDLRKRGLARARLFTWEKTASQTLATYHRAMTG